MELWRELIDLEHSNMTRNGEWLELVKRKAERIDATKKAKQEAGSEPQKPQSKRALHKAVQAEAKINQLKAETKAARKNRGRVDDSPPW